MKEEVIICKEVLYEYNYFEKAEGLAGSIKDFFFREVKKKRAVDNVTLCINKGELVGLLGPNGAGKTTLIKMLIGILKPEAGEVYCNGSVPYDREYGFLKKIGVVLGQKSQLSWDLPAMDTLYLLREIYEIPRKVFDERVNDLAEKLNVSDKLRIPVRKLSLGERVKCELICSLIHNPDILFLDEPTLGMDIVSQRFVYDFLNTLNQTKKTTIIFTSHYIQDIENLAQRVILIKEGKIVSDGTLNQLKENYKSERSYVIETDGTKPELDAIGVGMTRISDNKYKVYVDAESAMLKSISLSNVISIGEDKMELDEILESIFG
jgi:ABC-2 type transport system ATP-binding protein